MGQLSIINSSNDCIAWKLKTNRPGRYTVSPKQGIIPAKEHKDCTVVLSKLKAIPNSKTDKFLIQATKIDPQTDIADLPKLWKDRESKHDKKRGVYAYQSVTIKCFLNVETKPINVIHDYVSSESTAESPSKELKNETKKSKNCETAKSEIESIEISDPSKAKQEEKKIDKQSNDSIPASVKVGSEYNSQTVEQWRRKALEYDELFQFTRKTLAQRDELSARWKAETDKTRALQKMNDGMVEEKKRILSEYNKHRNEDDEKKEEFDDDNMLRRQDTIREMEEFEQESAKRSQGGYTISIIHIIITLLLMYASFQIGKAYQNIDDLANKDSL